MSVIEVEDVSKMFRLGVRGGDLRDRFSGLFGRKAVKEEKPEEFWALKDISFSVEQGESFGIIGHNGSGKSTLLKLITGIYAPTKGRIRKHGRLSALIEVGAGFHPDLTGRENIYLNGSVLGMKKREIDARFDEIVEFAELERFIDTPVKRYSSGMYMRLGFAVAAHVDPEIVLVDEVLAVGDESFQAKCMDKMLSLRREGKTVVFISHGMGSIMTLCRRVMLLSHGRQLALGDPKEVIKTYRTSVAIEKAQKLHGTGGGPVVIPESSREIEILGVVLRDSKGRICDTIASGEALQLECRYRAHVPVEGPVFGLGLWRTDGLQLYGFNTAFDDVSVGVVHGEGSFTVDFPALNLGAGTYRFHLDIAWPDRDMPGIFPSIDSLEEAAVFSVTSSAKSGGIVILPHLWEVSGPPAGAEDPVTITKSGPVLARALSSPTVAG